MGHGLRQEAHAASALNMMVLLLGAQASVEKAVALLEARDMDPGEHGVYFGQLLGMADPLTYVLGRNGYRVGCPDV